MSGADDIEAEAADMCCASCGISEVDEIKLKKCDDCDLVRYCSDDCKEDHRPDHEAKCKERAAELRDEILFTQPKSTYLGDCPICFLPMPLEHNKCTFQTCCSKRICNGCVNPYNTRIGKSSCPFCRQLTPSTNKEVTSNLIKRVAAKDPDAFNQMGSKHYEEGDYESAFECYTKAAALGGVDDHYRLGQLYAAGKGVEKDEEKKVYHLETAAIGGHIAARFILAHHEADNGRWKRAVKHWIINSKLGHDESIHMLKKCYKIGQVSKDDFAAALRAHKAAADATKSPQREAAENIFCGMSMRDMMHKKK